MFNSQLEHGWCLFSSCTYFVWTFSCPLDASHLEQMLQRDLIFLLQRDLIFFAIFAVYHKYCHCTSKSVKSHLFNNFLFLSTFNRAIRFIWILFLMPVLDVGFHVVVSVIFVVTEFTFEELLIVVHKSDVSGKLHFVCKNLSTFTTFNLDCCFLFLRQFANFLMASDGRNLKVQSTVGTRLIFFLTMQ